MCRYAVREEWADFQLKQGVILAFGFARGLGQVDFAHLHLDGTTALLDAAYQVVLAVGSSTLAFACAGAAVQAAVVSGKVSACKRPSGGVQSSERFL